MKVALVHDALINKGGAERVLLFLRRAFPGAPIFTSVYSPERTYPEFRDSDVRPLVARRHAPTEAEAKRLFLQIVAAFRRVNLDDYDLVVSSSTFGAKAVRVRGATRHVCYCYAPFRLLWAPDSYLRETTPGRSSLALLARTAFAPLRAWDRAITRKIDAVATTCRNMAARLRTCYGVEAEVIYAPIDVCQYQVAEEPGEFYLVVSRLNRYKRVDLAVEACNQLCRSLIIVGDGPELETLGRLAGPTVTFAGAVTDAELRAFYRRCRALLFPPDEDYGLAPLEAQASGRPVIALGRGGALETVRDGATGVFFDEQSVDGLAAAIRRFESMTFLPRAIRQHAERFDVEPFIRSVRRFAHGDTRA